MSIDLSREFPQNHDICYLNHAAVSPWPNRAATAVKSFAQENTVFGATNYPNWMKVETELREKLKHLINAKSTKEIALAKNTSEALSVIAYGITWQKGDTVLITNQEFPSNRIVWESLKNQGVNVRVVDVDNHETASQNIINHLNKSVRLLSLSAVEYASGLRLDLNAIGARCKEVDALFCIDAIQWLGALPFDAQKCHADFVVADGHKWMLGPEGLAVFYVREPLITTLKLHQFGWHMVKSRGNYDIQTWQPADDATRFECGSPNMLGATALNASLGVLLEFGMNEVARSLSAKTDYLIKSLQNLPGVTIISPTQPALKAGIVTFKVMNTDHQALYRSLMSKGVICACRGGGIRFSPHFYTPEPVLDNAISILTELINSQ
jgi:selenocysteine lyase/cysteine desulfurase